MHSAVTVLPTVGFLLLERAFDRVLVEWIDDQRRIPPCDFSSFGFHFRFRVGHLLDTGDDFQETPPKLDFVIASITFVTKQSHLP